MKTIHVLCIAALFFLSCNGTRNQAKKINFKNNNYQIAEVLSENVVSSNMSINFNSETGKISGNTGCNSYFGNFKYDGTNITITDVSATKKYCGDKEVNRKEQLLLKTLLEINRVTNDTKDEIQFRDNKDNILISAILE